MASIFSLLSVCCGGRTKDPSSSSSEPDERTALLNPDIIPDAPAQLMGKTTEEQLAEQETLRRILEQASSRFVNIEIPAGAPTVRRSPYAAYRRRPSTSSSSSSAATSPAPAMRPSTLWRPPSDTLEDDAGPGGKGGLRKAGSSHTLRTLPRSRTVSNNPELSATEGDEDEDGAASSSDAETYTTGREHANDGAGGSIFSSSNGSEFGGTAASYRTARDWDEESAHGTVRASRSTSAGSSGRKALRDIWSGEEGEREAEEEERREEEIAVKGIENSVIEVEAKASS